MTIEELDIIVEASIEPALKELKKLMPQIRQHIGQAAEVMQKSMNDIDMKSISNKIHKVVQSMKNKIESLKKSTQNNEIKIRVDNKDAEKQVSQIEKQISSLEEKINARKIKLGIITPKLDAIANQPMNKVVPERLESNKEYINLSDKETQLVEEIKFYNKQLDEAKTKMAQLKEEVSQTVTTQSKLSSFFSAFKGKLDQAKSSINGMKLHFNKMPKITQNITNNIKNMGTSLKSGLGHILKYAGALLGLRSIYSILRNSASAWLSSQNAGAQQLSANIEYMKYAMGSVFAPVLEYVINLVYQLMKAIQSLVYAFSGVNIFAKATASSMKSASGSAKEASKSLAGVHTEINNVSENNNGGGGGATTPSMDLSELDTSMNTWIEGIKAKLVTLFEPIKNSWKQYGEPLIESAKWAFTGIKNLVGEIGKSFEEVWLNGTGERTVSLILQTLTSIFNIIGNIGNTFANAWANNGGTEIIQNLWKGFNNLLDIIHQVIGTFEEWTASTSFQEFANAIIGICNTLYGWFEKITEKLKEIWENGGKQTFTKLLEFISKLVQAVDVVLKVLSPVVDFCLNITIPAIEGIIEAIGYVIEALSGVLDFIIGVFTGDWEKAWNGICDFFTEIWNAIVSIVDTVWNAIVSIVDVTLNVVWNIITTIFNAIGLFFSNTWNGIKDMVSNVFNGIKNIISNILNTISNIWNNIWNGIKTVVSNVWNGIWGTIKSIINSILGGIESFVNGTIRGINKLLGGISNVANAVGSLIGINPINLQLSYISIPKLAKGGILDSPTIAMMGEYSGAKSNPEIATPQNVLRETFEEVLLNHEWGNGNNDRPMYLTVNVGSRKIGEILLDDLRDMKRRTGKDIEALTGG